MADRFIAFSDAETDLLSAAAYLAERISSSDGRATAMLHVVPGYLKRDNVDLAAELSNSIDDPYVRDRLLGAVAEKCAELDDDEYAIQLAEAIDDVGLRSQALERSGIAKAAKGDHIAAQNIAAMAMHADGVYAAIAVDRAADGDRAGTDDAIRQMADPRAVVDTLGRIASAHIEKGERDAAAEVLEKAQETAGEIGHDEERLHALSEIGASFIDAGKSDKAILAFDNVRAEAEELDNVHRDNFLASAAVGLARAGSFELADRALDLVGDKTQMSLALLGFSREYSAKAQADEAVEALDEAHEVLRSQRETETRDSRAKFALFASIAAEYAVLGRAERALEIADRIPDDEQRTSGLTQIAAVAAASGDDEGIRRALAMIADTGDRAFALISVSDGSFAQGEMERSAAYLLDAYELAPDIPQVIVRANAFRAAAYRFSRLGDAERARVAASDAISSALLIREESSRAAAFAGLAALFDEAHFELDETELDAIRTVLATVR